MATLRGGGPLPHTARIGEHTFCEGDDALCVQVLDDGVLERVLGNREVLVEFVALALVGGAVQRAIGEQVWIRSLSDSGT